MAEHFYSGDALLRKYPDAIYYIIYGERSNGKTYWALNRALMRYFRYGEQFAYVRRLNEEVKKKQMSELFAGHIMNGALKYKYNTDGWTGIQVISNRFHLVRHTDTKKKTFEVSDSPIGYSFDINTAMKWKSVSFPGIKTIIFDEFLSRGGYLVNEFIEFTNLVSTIVRRRDDVKIFMLGNTVNKHCPYFKEMGLINIDRQKQGTVDVYKYGDSNLQVVVEYCENTAKYGGKPSDVYFAFNNPRLQMITEGGWELAAYPRLPHKYYPKDIVATFYIHFDNDLVKADIVATDSGERFLYFYRKEVAAITEAASYEEDISDYVPKGSRVYTTMYVSSPNFMMNLTRQGDILSRTIMGLIKENRAFFANNTTGEVIRNYLVWAASQSLINI